MNIICHNSYTVYIYVLSIINRIRIAIIICSIYLHNLGRAYDARRKGQPDPQVCCAHTHTHTRPIGNNNSSGDFRESSSERRRRAAQPARVTRLREFTDTVYARVCVRVIVYIFILYTYTCTCAYLFWNIIARFFAALRLITIIIVTRPYTYTCTPTCRTPGRRGRTRNARHNIIIITPVHTRPGSWLARKQTTVLTGAPAHSTYTYIYIYV